MTNPSRTLLSLNFDNKYFDDSYRQALKAVSLSNTYSKTLIKSDYNVYISCRACIVVSNREFDVHWAEVAAVTAVWKCATVLKIHTMLLQEATANNTKIQDTQFKGSLNSGEEFHQAEKLQLYFVSKDYSWDLMFMLFVILLSYNSLRGWANMCICSCFQETRIQQSLK